MDCKTYNFVVVLLAVANNLQRLLNLNVCIIIISCYGLQRSVEMELMPTRTLEMATILAVPREVVRGLGNVLVNIMLHQTKSLWIVIVRSNQQYSLIV